MASASSALGAQSQAFAPTSTSSTMLCPLHEAASHLHPPAAPLLTHLLLAALLSGGLWGRCAAHSGCAAGAPEGGMGLDGGCSQTGCRWRGLVHEGRRGQAHNDWHLCWHGRRWRRRAPSKCRCTCQLARPTSCTAQTGGGLQAWAVWHQRTRMVGNEGQARHRSCPMRTAQTQGKDDVYQRMGKQWTLLCARGKSKGNGRRASKDGRTVGPVERTWPTCMRGPTCLQGCL